MFDFASVRLKGPTVLWATVVFMLFFYAAAGAVVFYREARNSGPCLLDSLPTESGSACLGSAFFVPIGLSDSWRLVVWVNDGDTIVLDDGTKVRYVGVNAPEVAHRNSAAQRFGQEASAFNRALVLGKKVRLDFDLEKKDVYGRTLAYVFLEDGTFVNAELLAQGYAVCLFRKPNDKYEEMFLQLLRGAMQTRVGLWMEFKNEGGPFIGNSRTRRFHRQECPLGKSISQKNRTFFQCTYDAYWAGYSPCKACLDKVDVGLRSNGKQAERK